MLILNQTWEALAAQASYRPGQLAKLCKVSLRTLQRHFAKNYGLTLGAWMRDIRVNQAYQRITSGEQIKAVAFDLGFKQLSHFSRVFKQVHGVAPRMIRKPSAGKPAVQPAPPAILIPTELRVVPQITLESAEPTQFPVPIAQVN